MVNIEKKFPSLLHVFSTKYHGSWNNPSRANGDFCDQIFACDCNSSGETKGVIYLPYGEQRHIANLNRSNSNEVKCNLSLL